MYKLKFKDLFEGDCVEDYMIGNEKQVLQEYIFRQIQKRNSKKVDIRNLVSQEC